MFSRTRRFAAIAAVFVALVAVAAGACAGGGDKGPSPDAGMTALAESPFRGGRVDPPYPKPAVVLTDTTGNPFDLRKETEGFITLFYIGYTHCPDICPTHMHDIAKVLKESDPAVAAKMKVVFVTADPERDTPQVLGDWLHFFNPAFIGLVPTKEQLKALLEELDMPQTVYTNIGGGNYTASHAAYVIAYTPDNQGRLAYPYGFTIEDWRHDLNKLAFIGWKDE
ncbi:MAG: SCO family protein [Anaerolinea sp.]|nr:SCO family protein [Anaerolinea sp.]